MKLPRHGRAPIAVVTLGLLAACGSPSSASVEPTPSAGSAVATVNSRPDGPAVPCTDLTTPVSTASPIASPPGAGDRLPDLSLPCLGGGADVNLADLRGPAVMNVWASWCGSCAQEAAYLVEAHRALGGTVRFLGLDVADDAADARAWNDFHHVDWPSLADPTSQVRGPLRVPGPPVTFFIRSDGTVAGVHYGAFTSTDEVRAAVDKQLGPIAKGIG